jgi:hypothetical protein
MATTKNIPDIFLMQQGIQQARQYLLGRPQFLTPISAYKVIMARTGNPSGNL